MRIGTRAADRAEVSMGPGNWILLGFLLLVVGVTIGPWVLTGWIVLKLVRGLRWLWSWIAHMAERGRTRDEPLRPLS